MKFHEDKIGNSTCIDGYRSVLADGSNSKAVWGYCFICGIGTPRPVIWIKQDTFLTPFLCLILKLLRGIEKRSFYMQIEDIYAAVEGNIGKVCEVTLKDGTKTGKVILHSTTADTTISPSPLYLILSHGKGKKITRFQKLKK